MAEPDKTEDATPKRLSDARKKGNVLRSQDVTTAVVLTTALIMFRILWQTTGQQLSVLVSNHLSRFPRGDLTNESLFRLALEDGTVLLKVVAPFALALLCTGLLANFIMIGPLLTTEPLRPNLSKINPISGFKRFFSAHSFVELIKGVGKMAIIGVIVWQVLSARYPVILTGFRMTPQKLAPILGEAAWTMGVRCILALIVFAVFDFAFQRYDYKKSLKMSKQEIKDESKQQEGDPVVKGEIRRRMRAAARRRMMQQVPQATVVITNPTHFAVALRYDRDVMPVPMVVAKGADDVAMRIRELATKSGVPIVENPPLAREIFRIADLGDEIPEALYTAVAEILVAVQKASPEKVAL